MAGGRKETKVLLLEGLGCASCATKIEQEVSDLSGIVKARLDFATAKLKIEAESKDSLDQALLFLPGIVQAAEPGVKILDPLNGAAVSALKETIDVKQALITSLGVCLFLVALIIKPAGWAQPILYVAGYLLIGRQVILTAVRNIIKGTIFDENFLMMAATLGALAIREYPEAVAVMLFYKIGEFFQDLAVHRSRRAIGSLINIRPDFAHLLEAGGERTVRPEEVKPGQSILVKPGEKVPLDGTVVNGSSFLDTSALTGEFTPRQVAAGGTVLAGFINKSGLLTVEVNKPFEQSTAARILELVENAAQRKAPAENFITKFARYYTPAVVLGALLMAVLPPLLIDGAVFSEWLQRALIFLVVSCPCALVISIPLSFFGGIGGASRQGILIKGSNYLEALNHIRTMVFDKTGTLTKGVFEVIRISPAEGFSEEQLLELTAWSEKYSSHPIASSIREKFGRRLEGRELSDLTEVSGKGVKALLDGLELRAGSARFLAEEGISLPDAEILLPDGISLSEQQETGTVVYLAVNGKYAGSISIADTIREDSLRTIQGLRLAGVEKIVMLTGDNRQVAAAIGRELGFDQVHAELLPDQKVAVVAQLAAEKLPSAKIAFLGDGMNDAPVLARADIGIAMGGLGSDAAIEAADIVLMTDEPSKLLTALRIAKKTENIVWQNLILALLVKGIVLLLGAFGLATMWEAVFADVGVALIAVFNAMRVMKQPAVK